MSAPHRTPPRRLKDTDVAETTMRIRAGVMFAIPALVIALFVSGMSGSAWAVPIALVCSVIVGAIVYRFADVVAAGFMRTLLSSGGEARSYEYSAQDALIMQGRHDDAIASFEAHILAEPQDAEARLRLADLLVSTPAHAERAEGVLLGARALPLTPGQEVRLANALIDLYRGRNDVDALKRELARFARRHEGSVEGRHARDYLRKLVEKDAE